MLLKTKLNLPMKMSSLKTLFLVVSIVLTLWFASNTINNKEVNKIHIDTWNKCNIIFYYPRMSKTDGMYLFLRVLDLSMDHILELMFYS